MEALRIIRSEVLAEDALIADYDPSMVLFATGVVVWAYFEEIHSLDRRMPFVSANMISEYLPGLKFLMEYCYGRPEQSDPKQRPVFSRRRKSNARY